MTVRLRLGPAAERRHWYIYDGVNPWGVGRVCEDQGRYLWQLYGDGNSRWHARTGDAGVTIAENGFETPTAALADCALFRAMAAQL